MLSWVLNTKGHIISTSCCLRDCFQEGHAGSLWERQLEQFNDLLPPLVPSALPREVTAPREVMTGSLGTGSWFTEL